MPERVEPVSFGDFIKEVHGLPVSSRTPEEVEEDYETKLICDESWGASLMRRGPKRASSQFVVELLDFYSDESQAIGRQAGNIALQFSVQDDHLY